MVHQESPLRLVFAASDLAGGQVLLEGLVGEGVGVQLLFHQQATAFFHLGEEEGHVGCLGLSTAYHLGQVGGDELLHLDARQLAHLDLVHGQGQPLQHGPLLGR